MSELKMKGLLILAVAFIISCSDAPQEKDASRYGDVIGAIDSTASPIDTSDVKGTATLPEKDTTVSAGKVYSNQRFKDVHVEKINAEDYKITGKAQVFEASFSWVIEDGHNELQKGHEMTNAGAPEFGEFSFKIHVAKKRPNSTLHLIIFEASAKDGSRQYELPILLY